MHHSQHIPYQNIPNGISTSGYVDKLEEFLETHLSSFPFEVSSTESERSISDKIYCHLQRQSRLTNAPFDFQPEFLQKSGKGHDKSVDFGVNLNTYDIDMELIYCIEAKRLPTDKPNGEREKEYVFGKGGGIERFKTDKGHGKNRRCELLERNGMIGYVQQNDFEHWHSTINHWIENDTDWGIEETLKKGESASIGKYQSEHIRSTKDKVFLTHFWLNLC